MITRDRLRTRAPQPQAGARPRLRALLVVLLLLIALAADAMTLSQAIRKVQRETGGKVLSAQTEVEGNREVHVIRVLTKDGRVRQIRVPGDRVKGRKDGSRARPGR